MLRPVLIVLFSFLALCLPARAQLFSGEEKVTPSLIADTTAVVAGKPFTAGVRLKMKSGWHTYWQFGGSSGAPTRISWQLPEGFKASPIQWPLPTARVDEGELTYIYENDVLLLVEITPPAQLPSTGSISLKANLHWLVCEKLCVPGEGDVSLDLPVAAEAAPANAELFAQWRAQLPKSTPFPFALQWETGAKEIKARLSGLPKEFKAEFFPLPGEAQVGQPAISEPAADGSRVITIPVEGDTKGFKGVLATQKDGAPRESWAVSRTDSAVVAPAAAAPAAVAVPSSTQSAIATRAATPGLLGILWAAFLGGLILNLMPCVLPVIALKIFGFVQQAGEEPRRVFRLGLAFVAGVFTFFLCLAALVVGFQAAGHGLTWGFQFQNPYILAALIGVVFVFALSMFGVFEIILGSDTATALDSLSRKDGYSGAFAHGMFTTLLGTSCTAPFLGGVLGYAFVQPAHVVILIFAVVAAGMSLPYFLLTWQPAWMRFLPKPGAWMERMKQFMGFVLLGVALWLLSVLGATGGTNAIVATTAFLLVLGVACWIYGFARGIVAKIIVLALVIAGWFFILKGQLDSKPVQNNGQAQNVEGGIPWQSFSDEKLMAAVQRGEPVFIDFTADWCLNCKYNERVVIETEPVRAAFKEKKIVALKADWTNGDKKITEMLKRFGRVGVPAYLYYPGNGSESPVVLPEILTQTSLLHTLSQTKP
ncbi:MAG: dsbD [Chthoniobacteraceae bacterium]|nr:dsbD [Chthoniobacteraceae bacterium]